jgi:YqaJ-like viral recombinase domain
MKILECEQNTLQWLNYHIGIPTAGGLAELVDTKFEIRTGETPKTYLCKKLAEAYRGKPLISLGSNGASGAFSVEQGMILEEEALPFFEFQTNSNVQRVGFVTTDDGKFGCSPDGFILAKNGKPMAGLEIKCPAAETHVKYLLAGEVPKEYRAQVHGGMYATGLFHWVFMSYRRGFPALFVKVDRDPEIIQKITHALDSFYTAFDEKREILNQFEMPK